MSSYTVNEDGVSPPFRITTIIVVIVISGVSRGATAESSSVSRHHEGLGLLRDFMGSLTLTWTMSNDLPVLTSLTENSTDVPVSAGQVENYVLLLVLLSVFAGGTLVLLSLLLLFCHRCCMGGRRYSRASDDPEKTNTTYAEDSQPTQEITIRLDESDALSASSCHDGESERFVSTGSTGRRVSFNESALYEQEKTTQNKGRRYTLTEGDFHHLKKARLTHLHLPPAPCDLKILTIMECDSADSSTINISETTAPKLPLSIYQPSERVPDWMGQSLSGGLPGDPHHSIVLDQGPRPASSTMKTQHTRSQTMEAIGDRGETESEMGMRGELTQAPGQTSVLHFFSKLRRHASLEGAGPYFRRWKFDSSHRAASLDAKGSPKRRPFQRQRAASETTDHTDDDSLTLQDESFPHSPILTSGLQSLSAESLSHHATTPTSSVFLSRLELVDMMEVGGGSSTRREEPCLPPDDCRAKKPEEATTNGIGVEKETKFGAGVRSGAPGLELESAEEDDLFGPQQEAAIQERDIWSLRASLEQYASSDQSSTDRESIRSDADSVSSLGGAGARSGLDSCLSQDLDDEPEGEGEVEGLEGGVRGASGGHTEMGSGAGGENEAGNRKLLQMDSGYASIEAPSRAPEEMRLFGTPGAPRGKTASERRLFFTSSGRKGSVCESIEAKLFQEELEDEMADNTETEEKIKESPHRPRLRRRDYSIDEKTDALFNEFLRHDPRFDQQDSPLRSRHRSRVHLRKQWQRHKQYSDPGSGTGGSAANKTCEGTDAKKSSSGCAGLGGEGNGCQVSKNNDTESTTSQSLSTVTAHISHMDPRVDNRNNNSSQAILSEVSLQAEDSLSDKLVVSVEERLYGGLRSAEKLGQGGPEHVLT
ncbi:hypothetical protein INR49_010564, partial [Caranx melampygus]